METDSRPHHRNPDLTMLIPWGYLLPLHGQDMGKKYLQQKLDDFSVDESMYRLSIDVCDEIPSLQACLVCGTSFFYILHRVQEESTYS